MLLRRCRLTTRSPLWRLLRLVAITAIVTGVLVNFFPRLLFPTRSETLIDDVVYLENAPDIKNGLPQVHQANLHIVLPVAEKLLLRPEAPMRQLHAQAQSLATHLPDDAAPALAPARAAPPPATPAPQDGEEDMVRAPVGKEAAPGDGFGVVREGTPSDAPCAWVPYRKSDTIIHYIAVVLERFGYEIRHRDENFEDCALIWTFEYPFWEHCWSQKLFKYATHSLRRHQKINHFPGIGYITNKASLARFGCDSCPTSFLIPEDVDRFMGIAKQNSNWTWVIKNKWHRGVKVIKPEEVNTNEGEMFIQAFVSNPLLISGRKFDFSVYVALTSINPLRVYMYDSDWAARFCKKDYNPVDASDTKKYVVYGTDHTPIWEIPSLKTYWDLGYGFKKSLFIHLQKLGFDTDTLEQSVQDVIRDTFVRKERSFMSAIRYDFYAQNHTRNLFELVRFDFLVDDRLRLYLMEANMSPDLSVRPGSPRAQLYKNMLHDLLSMVGVGKVINGRGSHGSHEDYDLLSSPGDLRVFSQECFTKKCTDNCHHEVCHMCTQCLSFRTTTNLLHAFMEHAQRHGFRRVVPAPLKSPTAARNWNIKDDATFQRLSPENKIIFTWFRGKCAQDVTWCS